MPITSVSKQQELSIIPLTPLPEETHYASLILTHFHPQGLRCSHCGASSSQGYAFRTTQKSKLTVYRCRCCDGIYNLYSQTIFEARHLRPSQIIHLITGFVQGDSAATIARQVKISRTTAAELCQLLKSENTHLQLRLLVTPCDEQN